MSGKPVRFIHAADLHLEQPLRGLSRIPQELREALIEAPFRAAQRIFETARLERVDFVVLSGDILQPLEAGASSLCFVIEQLELLATAKIPVYWAGGQVDRFHQWPKAAKLPDTVYRAGSRDVRAEAFYRDGDVAALLQVSGYQGRGSLDAARLGTESEQVPLVVVAYGEVDFEQAASTPVDFWAMGGRHTRQTERREETVLHYPGTPQGRNPEEFGPHGCSLIELCEEREPDIQLIECDTIQFTRREMRLTASSSRRKVERHLVELTKDLLAEQHHQPQLVNWAIHGTDRVTWASPPVAEEMLEMLRKRFEAAVPKLWISGVEFLYPTAFPESVADAETIASDFYEIVKQCRSCNEWPQVLGDQLEEHPIVKELVAGMLPRNKRQREELLRQVVFFGLGLLGSPPSAAEQDVSTSHSLREAS